MSKHTHKDAKAVVPVAAVEPEVVTDEDVALAEADAKREVAEAEAALARAASLKIAKASSPVVFIPTKGATPTLEAMNARSHQVSKSLKMQKDAAFDEAVKAVEKAFSRSVKGGV